MTILLAIGIWLLLLGVVACLENGGRSPERKPLDESAPYHRYLLSNLKDSAFTTQIVRGFNESRKARRFIFAGSLLIGIALIARLVVESPAP